MEEEIKMTSDIPQTKINKIMDEIDIEIQSVKHVYDTLRTKQKQLKKAISKMESKMLKKQNKKSVPRQPCGFAKPSNISKDMCEFLNIPEGSLASRTQVTKNLIQYIKEHKLQGQVNRREICPDDVLYKLFGDAARGQVITYFTMQKYMNHHFIKATEHSP
jgi:chromatin remodeling complex protein RSC6